jgi:hypothetical protein
MWKFLMFALFISLPSAANAGQECNFYKKYQGMYVYKCIDGSTKISQTPLHPVKRGRPAKSAVHGERQGADLAKTDPVLYIVQESQRVGMIKKVELDDRWMNVYVSPRFHNEDHDHKKVVMASFLAWGQREHQSMDVVFIFDSRDRKRLGRYHSKLGLKLKRPKQ